MGRMASFEPDLAVLWLESIHSESGRSAVGISAELYQRLKKLGTKIKYKNEITFFLMEKNILPKVGHHKHQIKTLNASHRKPQQPS